MDNFYFSQYKDLAEVAQTKESYSKRQISSIIPPIFDLNGFLSPFITQGKIFLQRAWTCKNFEGKVYDWDTKLPNEISEDLRNWLLDLPTVAKQCVPRYIFGKNSDMRNTKEDQDCSERHYRKALPTENLELHAFGDGGTYGFRSCTYLRFPVED